MFSPAFFRPPRRRSQRRRSTVWLTIVCGIAWTQMCSPVAQAQLELPTGGLPTSHSPTHAPVVLEEQEAVARFEQIAILPLGADSDTFEISLDPISGTVLITSPDTFSRNWLESLSERVESGSQFANVQIVSGESVLLTLASLATGVALIQGDTERVLIAGHLRRIDSLRQHFFGAQCMASLPEVKDEDALVAFEAYCEGSPVQAGTALASVYDAHDEERELMRLIIREADFELGSDILVHIERFLERPGLSPDNQLTGWVSFALAHALRDEIPMALDALHQARGISGGGVSGRSLQPQAVVAIGSVWFERLMLGSFANDNIVAALFYYERYRSWESTLNHPLRHRVAEAYRALSMSEQAAQIYMDLFLDEPANETQIMRAMVESYLEADDVFRAHETLIFLRERYPRRNFRELEQLVAAAPESYEGWFPADGCQEEVDRTEPISLLVHIGCAQRQSEFSRALTYAQTLRELTDGDETRAVYFRLAGLWEESLRWEAEQLR